MQLRTTPGARLAFITEGLEGFNAQKKNETGVLKALSKSYLATLINKKTPGDE